MTHLRTRDTVYIMRDAFTAEQLNSLTSDLEKGFHRTCTFEGAENLNAALRQPGFELLWLSTRNNELCELVDILRNQPDERNAPTARLCFSGSPSSRGKLRSAEIALLVRELCLAIRLVTNSNC